MKKYEDLVAQCDLLIRAGKISAVSMLIAKVNLAQVPRACRQSLAKICRRAGLVTQGLRLLQPIIRRETERTESPASEGEICEYAVLLSRNGSIQEALGLLKKIEAAKTPEAYLYLAYCHISNWDYALATGFLENFLKSDADSYSKLIARVNLSASYIAISNFEKAAELLNETIEIAQVSSASRLVGNCLQLRGQLHFRQNDFISSRKDLEQAQKIFGDSLSYDQLLIQKWQTIMKAIESKAVAPLLEFREVALKRKHWESVREADLFAVKVQFDQSRFDYLVLGTPMAAYRTKIQQEVGIPACSSGIYGDQTAELCLDLKSGRFKGSAELNPGKKIHQVIAALVRDFYVPRNMGTLFSELYPNEYFDINSSPLRVRQLLKRTRRWLEENKIPARIEQHKGSYRLSVHGKFGIEIPLQSEAIDPNQLRWDELQRHFPRGILFSSEEACLKLNWSRSTFLRLSEWALKTGVMKKTGINKATRYQVQSEAAASLIKSAA